MKIKKLDQDAIIPKYQTAGAAGFDLHSIVNEELNPGEQKLIGTGLSVAVPDGFELQIRPRSGLAAKYKVTVTNSPGTVDQDYRGEIKIILINLGQEKFIINKGDRIAQGVVCPVKQVIFEEVEELPSTERGSGGFGSTG